MWRGQTPVERFFSRVDSSADPDACWLWTAPLHHSGYAHFYAEGRETGAHRWSYERFVGPIPEGHELDHLCRVKHCVNPRHLEPVTHAENVRRGESGANKRSNTHCPQGHPYEGANLGTRKDARVCRVCGAAASRRHYQRKKEAAEAARAAISRP